MPANTVYVGRTGERPENPYCNPFKVGEAVRLPSGLTIKAWDIGHSLRNNVAVDYGLQEEDSGWKSSHHWQARAAFELGEATSQFQSDLRVLKEELVETQKTITAAIVIYDHYRSGQAITHAEGKTEKAKFLSME